MPVAFDAVTGAVADSSSSLSFSHTCSGDERVLYVAAAMQNINTDVSALTYGGVSLTIVERREGGIGTFDGAVEIWRLIAPATGANTVSVTFDAVDGIKAMAISWTGADQTTPNGSFTSNVGNSTTPSVDISSATDEIVFDYTTLTEESGTGPTFTVGAGQTERVNHSENAYARSGGSTEAGATTVTMSWTSSTSDNWVAAGLSVKPAAAAAGAEGGGPRTFAAFVPGFP